MFRLHMVRLFSNLLVVFVLLAGPAICIGGLLPHECDCGPGEIELECGHEDACTDDPCETFAKAVTDREAGSSLFDELPTLFEVPFATGPEPRAQLAPSAPASPLPPHEPNLPYPRSDRPLRI